MPFFYNLFTFYFLPEIHCTDTNPQILHKHHLIHRGWLSNLAVNSLISFSATARDNEDLTQTQTQTHTTR